MMQRRQITQMIGLALLRIQQLSPMTKQIDLQKSPWLNPRNKVECPMLNEARKTDGKWPWDHLPHIGEVNETMPVISLHLATH